MPMYDLRCDMCGHTDYDVYEAINANREHCGHCDEGGVMQRVILPTRRAIITDEIPGGVEIKHGLCNPDGSPRRYYSKSEIAREAAKRGLENHVVHRGSHGSDKSPHTSRWV